MYDDRTPRPDENAEPLGGFADETGGGERVGAPEGERRRARPDGGHRRIATNGAFAPGDADEPGLAADDDSIFGGDLSGDLSDIGDDLPEGDLSEGEPIGFSIPDGDLSADDLSLPDGDLSDGDLSADDLSDNDPADLPDEGDPAPDDADALWVRRLSTRFDGLTDEEVVAVAQGGDSVAFEFLLNKYKNFVRSKARSYFLIGADHEDIVQEGMIGLFKAIRDYQAERLSSFRAFSELCITRQIITAIKTATRQKHVPLNSYVSLNKPIYDEESDRTLMDVIVEGHAQNPEELIIGRENLSSIRDRVQSVLSPLEQEVLAAYLDGKSYQEIAVVLGRHVKSIDNALQRVKRKLEKYLEESKAQEE